MEEKNNTNVGGLEFLDLAPEVKEFIRKTDTQTRGDRRMDGKKTLQRKRRKRQGGNRRQLWLTAAVLIFAAVILCGIFMLKMPVATVILVAVLELVLSLCLCQSPIWLHGLVLLLQLILGILFHMLVFILLVCVVYLAGIGALHMWRER